MRSGNWCSTALLLFCTSVACTPSAPVDLSQHSDPVLSARANSSYLRPEFITHLSHEFLRTSDSLGESEIGDFFVGHGLIAASLAGQRAIVELLEYSESSASALLAHTFDAKNVRILGTAESTFVWAVDQLTGNVFLEDVGANERQRGAFRPHDSLHSACLTSKGVAYFADGNQPDAIWRQGFNDSVIDDVPHRVALSQTVSANTPPQDLRGGGESHCVLFSDVRDSFFVIDPIAEQVEAVAHVESALTVHDQERTVDRWQRTLHERRQPVRTARDIAIGDDLIAVLFAGRSTERLRLVDFYHPSLGYRGSVRLPMRAERIALAYGRLYALTRSAKEALLVSFVLPAEYRTAIDSLPTQQLEGRVPEAFINTQRGATP